MKPALDKIPALSLMLAIIPMITMLAGVVSLPGSALIALLFAGTAASFLLSRSAAISADLRLAESAESADRLKQEINELARKNLSYERLMVTTNDAILVVDSDGRVIEANRTVAELLGYNSEELVGHFVPDFAPATERQRIKAFIADAFASGSSTTEDLMLNQLSGSQSWFDGMATRIDIEDRSIAQIILKDITERKRQFILTEKEISFLHELSRTLPLLQDFDEMLDRTLSMLMEALPFHGFALVLAEPDDMKAIICIGKKTKAPFINEVRDCVADVLSEIGDNIDPSLVEYKIEKKGGIEPAGSSVGSQIMLPLAIVNGIAGLFSSKENAFKKEDLSLFSTLVSGISSLYIAYKSYQRVQHLSVTDSLTGLFNRRKFFEELEREVERVSRYGSPLSLLMLDIDHFKSINDQYGHQMGDEVLRALSQILLDNTRKTDLTARYGGEEFIIMLPETPQQGALGVADRIRQAVERAPVLGAAIELKFTVSLGLADFVKGDTVDSLVGRTDKALYAAKENGRNRVELLTG